MKSATFAIALLAVSVVSSAETVEPKYVPFQEAANRMHIVLQYYYTCMHGDALKTTFSFGTNAKELAKSMARDMGLDATKVNRPSQVYKTNDEFEAARTKIKTEWLQLLKTANFSPKKRLESSLLERVDLYQPAKDGADKLRPELIQLTRAYAKLKGWSEFTVEVSLDLVRRTEMCDGDKWAGLAKK